VKHVVIDEEARSWDIRPPGRLAEMQDAARRDAARFLLADGVRQDVACPACESAGVAREYVKEGFRYATCAECATVYASPRPGLEALRRYYRESDAAAARLRYLAESEAQEGRSEVNWARARWMCRLMDEAGPRTDRTLLDMYGRYPSLLTELATLGCFSSISSYRPDVPPPGTGDDHDAKLPGNLAAVSLFEHLEHAHEPAARLAEIAEAMRAGGMLFVTTRSSSGFDLQLLGEFAPYIFPPEHLNLLSVEGVSRLLDRTGFDIVELSTPGQLDVEFVGETLRQTRGAVTDPFWRYFFDHRDAEARQDLQYFLQKHRLSSHLRIAARKRGSSQ
jgi:hypothetical protein